MPACEALVLSFPFFFLLHLGFGMCTKLTQVKHKPSVCSCPQGCSFSLHEKYQHKACPACQGIIHAQKALEEPEASACCHQLCHSILETRVKFLKKALEEATNSW